MPRGFRFLSGQSFRACPVPAKTAKKAYKDNISLKEACVELGFLTAERFDEVFHPEEMV